MVASCDYTIVLISRLLVTTQKTGPSQIKLFNAPSLHPLYAAAATKVGNEHPPNAGRFSHSRGKNVYFTGHVTLSIWEVFLIQNPHVEMGRFDKK